MPPLPESPVHFPSSFFRSPPSFSSAARAEKLAPNTTANASPIPMRLVIIVSTSVCKRIVHPPNRLPPGWPT